MPANKKQCTRKKGEDESEKAATISTGTHSAVIVAKAKNCEPVYSPLLDYLCNSKPPVPRAFNSQ